jgi:endoribonuclease L-PSP
MKRNFIFATLVCAAASVFFSTSLHAQTSTYNFIQLGADDLAAVQKDTKLWTVAGTQIKNAAVLGKAGKISATHPIESYAASLMADGKELEATKGLKFVTYIHNSNDCKIVGAGKLIFDPTNKEVNKKALSLYGSNLAIVLPNLKKGMKISATFMSQTSTQKRYLTSYNLDAGHTFVEPVSATVHTTAEGTVAQDGAVWLVSTNGLYVYDITLKDADGNLITTYINLQQTETSKDNRIYDLSGRYVGTDFDTLEHGVYILQGRKILK